MSKVWADDSIAPTAIRDLPKLKDPFSYRLKRFFLGAPINRHQLEHQKLSKIYALGVLSSDCISSSAYGSEQILLALLPAFGLAGFAILMPMTAVIIAILLVVTISYRQVVSVYTKTGGSYVVARDNFGTGVAQVAAVALMLDYIVTVAVQTAAGSAALISAFPALGPYNLEITLGVIAILFYGNLKGVKEAGRFFAAPTYLFFGSVSFVLIVGVIEKLTGHLHKTILGTGTIQFGSSKSLLSFATIYVLLRALANGGSSLTGLEAISNGVSLFKSPEGRNARITTVLMASMLGFLVVGVSTLAVWTHSTPYESGTPTVISQIASTVMGAGLFGHIVFLFVQFSTMLILWTGANTPFSGFPFLANFIAEDGFLPHQLSKRGHRLVFSNGIFFLTLTSALLLIIVGPHVDKLVAFYAIGVFTGFTLAGFGMAKRTFIRKEKNWKLNAAINFSSGSISALIVLIFAVVKFTEGAWLIVVIFPIAVLLLLRLHRQYVAEQSVLGIDDGRGRATSISTHKVSVCVDNVDLSTVATIRYARSLRPNSLSAIHFIIDDARASEIKRRWESNKSLSDVQLKFIDCPDRRLPEAALDFAARETMDENTELTLLFPRRTYSAFAGRILHDNTAESMAAPLAQLPRVLATIVPFDVKKLMKRVGKPIEVESRKPEVISKEPIRVRVLEESKQVEKNYDEKIVREIAKVAWRKRSTIEGRITAIAASTIASSPMVSIEVWDASAGLTLQFLGRREIAGIKVGSVIRAYGMVGEYKGALTIANPTYEIIKS